MLWPPVSECRAIMGSVSTLQRFTSYNQKTALLSPLHAPDISYNTIARDLELHCQTRHPITAGTSLPRPITLLLQSPMRPA